MLLLPEDRRSGKKPAAVDAAAADKSGAKATKSDASESNASLPPMEVGQRVEASDIEPDGHETQPPARYTEATLVKTLEAKEIGRPSTYASIISTIMDRGYVYERGRALIPSWLAFSVTKLLETNFPKLVDYTFTAEMENGLDRIAHGEETGRDWLTHFYFGSGEGAARNADEAHEGLQQQVAQLGEIDARAINTIDIGDGLHVRVGRYGPYLEDMEHLDAEGNPKRASLPDTIAPDELTVEVAHDLTDNHSSLVLRQTPCNASLRAMLAERFGNIVTVDYQPTCENMLGDFARRISRRLPEGVELHSLRLHETATSFAEWFAEDNR